jgi:outer membrane protein OmpA-like peptidoglycan-associated protein
MPDAPNILYCINVDVEGHEDEVGDPGHFGAVGLARALKIAQLLQKVLEPQIASLPAANRRNVNVNVSTAGPVRPIRSNVTEAGRAVNRRVEIRIHVDPCGPIA